MKRNILPLLIIILPIVFVAIFLWFLYGRDDLTNNSPYTKEELRFLKEQGFSSEKSKDIIGQNLDSEQESFKVLASKIDLNGKYQMAFVLENKTNQPKDFYLIPVSKQDQLEFKGIFSSKDINQEAMNKPLSELYNVEKHKKELTPELAKAYDDINNNNYKAKPVKITLEPKSSLLATSEWDIVSINKLEPVYLLMQGSAAGAKDSLIILTVHSHPQKGDNWEVEFQTRGQADLKIIPNDQATIDDDEFTGLYCDNEKRTPQILPGDVIYYPDWQCSGIGKVIHYTLKAGSHTLRFEFASITAFAYNSVEGVKMTVGSSAMRLDEAAIRLGRPACLGYSTFVDLFNGTISGFPGGSQANGGGDDYNNGGSAPTDRYEATWTACTSGNSYCGTGLSSADAMDNNTGLVWSLPCNGSGCSSFSDSSPSMYSWDNSGGNNNSQTASQLCTAGSHGESGWYLPHQKQLMQAYTDGSYDNLEAAAVNRRYWSATTYSANTSNAWYTYLSHGLTGNLAKTNSLYVRCVRPASSNYCMTDTLADLFNGTISGFPGGSQANGGGDDYNNGGSAPTDRYEAVWTACTSGNSYCGTGLSSADTMDNNTGLIWSLPCNGSGCSSFSDSSPLTYTWDNSGGNNNSQTASQLCTAGSHGESGWYLPHQKQLMQAYIDGSYGNLEATGVSRYYWSATTDSASTSYAWGPNLSRGFTDYLAKTSSYYVRCVRQAP